MISPSYVSGNSTPQMMNDDVRYNFMQTCSMTIKSCKVEKISLTASDSASASACDSRLSKQ